VAIETCPVCQRSKESGSQCGYCLGRKLGDAYWEAQAGGGQSPRGGSGGCALILLATAVFPFALDMVGVLVQG
jgi:hypothetical protein